MKLNNVINDPVMSFNEAVAFLGWTTSSGKNSCKCNCGNSKISYHGYFGTEIVRCESCGKTIKDLFYPEATESHNYGLLFVEDFEIEKDKEGNPKYWIAFEN